MRVSKKKLDKLETILTSKTSCFDFFQALYLSYDNNSAGRLIHTFEDGRVNLVIKGPAFDDEFCKWLLSIPDISKYFKDLKELRFVASNVTIQTAKSFKKLNTNMLIYHVTYEDYMDIILNCNEDPAKSKANIADMEKLNLHPI